MRLPAGTFEWIDTGDPMPAGADTVVMREWLLPQAGRQRHHRARWPRGPGADARTVPSAVADADADADADATSVVPRGKNVRRAGEDFAAGEVLVPAGRRLRPGDLAAAAAGGHASLLVARQPVVAIIPTGDEIRPLGSTARPGEILDTNSLMLAARCRQLSAVPLLSEIQPDDPDALAAEIRRCAPVADLVLVIAGLKPWPRRPRRRRARPGGRRSRSPASRSGPVTRRCSATPSTRATPRGRLRSGGPGSRRSSACPAIRWPPP